jgi:hypothetical protein
MSKSPLNLLVQISKAFVYSKIQILFGNNSPQLSAHLTFRPSRGPFFFFFPTGCSPSPHWALASRPAQPARALVAPCRIATSLIPLLTSPLPSMALMPLTPLLLPLATPLWRSPGPYQRAMRPPTLTAPHPLSPELFRALLHPRDELKLLLFVASGVPSLRHPSVAGEHLPSTASTSSSSPLHRRRAPASSSAHAPHAGDTPPCPLSAVHRGPVLSAVHCTMDSVHGIFR